MRACSLIVAGMSLLSTTLRAQEPEPIEAGLPPTAWAYAPGIDVTHYDVEIGLGLNTDWFVGEVQIHVTAVSPSQSCRSTSRASKYSKWRAGGPQPYAHQAGVLTVPLSDLGAGEEATVTIRYRGTPDDGLILRENVHGAPSAFVDNWPNRTRFWMPSVDHHSDKATVRFVVHAPVEWRVIANGHMASGPVLRCGP